MSQALPTVRLENFEGPFDLLLELARAKKVDLLQVSLSTITQGYLNYLQQNVVPAAIQADFIMVAATLLLLKVRRLLPDLTPQEEDEIQELTDRVRLYQLYREEAQYLRERWATAPLLPGPEQLAVSQALPYPAYTPPELEQTWEQVLGRIRALRKPTRHLRSKGRTLKECLEFLVKRLQRVKKFWFHEAMAGQTKPTAAVSFLALLELARRGQVQVHQADAFAPISIKKSA
jgi:segregation and condensation protein A